MYDVAANSLIFSHVVRKSKGNRWVVMFPVERTTVTAVGEQESSEHTLQ